MNKRSQNCLLLLLVLATNVLFAQRDGSLATPFDLNSGSKEVLAFNGALEKIDSPDNLAPVLFNKSDKKIKPLVADSTMNVKSFGAVGDGVTDDTQAFQDAIDYHLALGGRIFIPVGTYKITNTLTIGDTKGISIIGESPQGTVVRFDNSVEDKELFYLSPSSTYCTFESFQVQDGTPGKSIAFKAKDQINIADTRPNWKMYFHNMRILFFKIGYLATTDTPLTGANHGFLDGVTFSHCKFRNNEISYYNQNSQAVNINFFNTDSENDASGERYVHIKDDTGFTMNIFGGSWIGRGKIYEGIYSDSATNLFASGNITFTGTRFEIRSGSLGDLISLPKRYPVIFMNVVMNGCSFAGFGQTIPFVKFAGKSNIQINDCVVVSGNFVIKQYPTSGVSGADAVGGMHSYGSVRINRSRGFSYMKADSSFLGALQTDHVAPVRIEQVPFGPNGQFVADAQSFMALASPEMSQRGAGLGTTTSSMLVYNSDNPARGFKSLKLKLPYYSTPMSLVLFKQPIAYADAITYKLYVVKDNADWANPASFNPATDAILIADSGSTANKAGYMEFPISLTNTYLNATSYFQAGFGKWLEGRLYLEHSGSANNFKGFVGIKYL